MTKRASAFGIVALAIAGALSVTPLSAAQAQSNAGERVFVDLGRWTIYETSAPGFCLLRMRRGGNAGLLFQKRGSDPARLTVQPASRGRFAGDVVFAFDEAEFEGAVSSRGNYATINGGSRLEEAFRQARVLTVRHGEATVAQISLDTSSAAFRLLKQCAEQGRIGLRAEDAQRQLARREAAQGEAPAREPARRETPSRRAANNAAASTPPAQSTPTQSAPASSRAAPPAPQSLSRGPLAIEPQNWVTGADRIRVPRSGGGILGFTLNVDARGRAQECVVNRSTGSRDLDGQLCRLLQRRARFEPAQNDQGEAVAGRFSSSIRYEVTE